MRNKVGLPILRKDFTIDAFQIYEAAEAGADAILLIVAALEKDTVVSFLRIANELGMDALVEVHSRSEMEVAVEVGAKLIGVNNRNLKTFDVSLNVSHELAQIAPSDVVLVSESGIDSFDEIRELRESGYSGFLIGETLMRSGDPECMVRELSGRSQS